MKKLSTAPTLAEVIFAAMDHIPLGDELDLKARLKQLVTDHVVSNVRREGGYFQAYQIATVHQAERERFPGQKERFQDSIYFTQNEPFALALHQHHIRASLMPGVLKYFPGAAQAGGVSLAVPKTRSYKVHFMSDSKLAQYLTKIFTLKPGENKPLLHLNEPYASLLLRSDRPAFGRPLEWQIPPTSLF
ncbi:MAG: hypothetical protein Q8L34_01950 [Candidatus Woesearchaeota archaeon]|nr:hypothetical protein [Candidatus Woesearchaeota archaeon]